MIESDCTVGCCCSTEVLEIGACLVVKFCSEPLIEALYIRNLFHDLHAYRRTEKLGFRFLSCPDFDDPVSLAALIGQQTELRDVADHGSHQVDDSRIAVASCAEY